MSYDDDIDDDAEEPVLPRGTCPPYIQQGMRLLRPGDTIPWVVRNIYEDGDATRILLRGVKPGLVLTEMGVVNTVARTYTLARDFDPNVEITR